MAHSTPSKRGGRVDERLDALPHQHLAPFAVPVDVALTADRRHRRHLLGHLVPQRFHGGPVGERLVGTLIEAASQHRSDGHGVPSLAGPVISTFGVAPVDAVSLGRHRTEPARRAARSSQQVSGRRLPD